MTLYTTNLAANILFQTLNLSEHSDKMQPDTFSNQLEITPPAIDFVLCRDENGNPTAIYGEDVWDFNPYKLSATAVPKFNFRTIQGIDNQHTLQLIKEAKWILFCFIYKVGAGRLGRLSVKTLYQYYRITCIFADFASDVSKNPFTNRKIKISDVLANEKFLYEISIPKKRLNAYITKLCNLGKEKLGFPVFYLKQSYKRDDKQHPVIPVMLYLHYINSLTEELNELYKNTSQIEFFLSNFSEKGYGLTHESQKCLKISKKNLKPTISKAIVQYGLVNTLNGVSSKQKLINRIKQIQFTLKAVIHLYTGMRDQEVLSLPYDCLSFYNIHPEEKDDKEKVVVPAKIIQLISATTKYTGYREVDAWYAPEIVEKAVEILQRIVRGLCGIKEINPKKAPLFQGLGFLIANSDSKIRVSSLHKLKKRGLPKWYLNAVITKEDMELLKASDLNRHFEDEKDINDELKFQINGIWPLTSHQFRRSLAFYASNAGFISLPTLTRQFKHLTSEITKYYSRNHENIECIFGHFDEKSESWKLPESHVLFDCQMAVPTSVANKLIDDLLNSGGALFGKSGSYMSKQMDRVFNGDVQIEEFRTTTENKIKKGEVAYNQTLLGGCTNINGCDCRILGEFTDCLSSDCAVIKKEKVEKQINEIQQAMLAYQPTDGEFQVLYVELQSLLKFKKYKMDARETQNEQ